MPSVAIQIALIAAWLAAMTGIKLVVAPAIVDQWGWAGVVVTLAALLAFARWLDREPSDSR